MILEIVIAKTAGFCFGVSKAVKILYELLDLTNKKIYTIGQIIHNDQVTNELNNKGVKIVEDISDVESHSIVVIRAHGVEPKVYEIAKELEIDLFDATCPYVKKIHKLVNQKNREGYQIIIVGDKGHPEVIGINGWCDKSAYIINSEKDIANLEDIQKRICVVAQTTITNEKWEKINLYLKEKYKNILKFDTICTATIKRQDEALKIAKNVESMIIIGSENSSNTQKLFEISKKECKNTMKIKTVCDINLEDFKKIKKIGITAGASTPEWVIKEVIKKMNQLNEQDEDIDFKEAIENSLVILTSGEVVKGKVIGFNDSEVYVDLGYKSDGIISKEEYSNDPTFKIKESVKIGEEIEVYIVRVNDGDGNVILSKKEVDAKKSFDQIIECYNKKLSIQVKIIQIINGGVLANANGVKIFIPASQLSNNYIKDFSPFLNQIVDVRIIELNERKKKIVERLKQEVDYKDCYCICRNYSANKFLWDLTHPPQHVNLI